MLGSMEPERVPIMMPSSGVNPMLVSTLLPSATAVTDAPFPRWQTISRSEFGWRVQKLGRAPRGVLKADAVESIAPDSLLEPGVGPRINVSGGLESGMKPGIEDRDLRHAGFR